MLTGVCVPPSGGRAFEVTVRGVEGEVRTLIDVLAPFSFGSDPTVRSLVVGVLDELQEDSGSRGSRRVCPGQGSVQPPFGLRHTLSVWLGTWNYHWLTAIR